MLHDILDQLATAYAVTTVATHINTAAVIDRLVNMDEGAGAPLYFEARCQAALTSGGAATIDISLIGNATDNTFSSGNVTLVDLQNGVPIAYTVGTLGYRWSAPIPRQPMQEYLAKGTPLRYMAFQVIIGTAVLTGGAFDAWLSNGPTQDNFAYAAGYSA